MAKKITRPHDRFTRETLGDLEVAKPFLKRQLPPRVAQLVTWDTLQLENDSFIDEELTFLETDKLYSAQMAGQLGYIYLLAEHQKSIDPLMPVRLNRYICSIIEEHMSKHSNDSPPLVFPLVLYQGETPYRAARHFLDIYPDELRPLAEQFWNNPFQLMDLARVPDQELMQYELASAWLMALKKVLGSDSEGLMELVRFIADFAQDYGETQARRAIIYCFKSNTVKLKDEQFKHQFVHAVQTQLPKSIGEDIMSLAEQFKMEGIEQGIEQAKRDNAIRMLKLGSETAFIHNATDLSFEEIEALRDELTD